MMEPQDALRRVVADVLERFAFSFVEGEEDSMKEDGECLRSDLAFSGPVRGTVSLAIPRELAMELGTNIMGDDAETVGAEVGEDAVKELNNIICGELLPLLYGPRAVFDLSVPELLVAASSGAAEEGIPPDACTVRLSAEGYCVTAWLATGE